MENIELTFADEALRAIAAQGDRAQDRRARPALHHGGDPARHHVRPAGLEGVEEVVITREVVEATARPLYIYADRSDRAVEKQRQRLIGAVAKPCIAGPPGVWRPFFASALRSWRHESLCDGRSGVRLTPRSPVAT